MRRSIRGGRVLRLPIIQEDQPGSWVLVTWPLETWATRLPAGDEQAVKVKAREWDFDFDVIQPEEGDQ